MLADTINRVTNAIFSNSGSAPGFLRPKDTEKIARNFDLDHVATENGRKNLPPFDSNVLDATEPKIVQ